MFINFYLASSCKNSFNSATVKASYKEKQDFKSSKFVQNYNNTYGDFTYNDNTYDTQYR